MSDLDQLTTLISHILGHDNNARKESEALLAQSRKQDLNNYVLLFCQLLTNSPHLEVKIFCISHIRRQISNYVELSNTSLWHLLPADTQKYLKTFLFERLTTESQSSKLLNLYADVIGELGATIKNLEPEVREQCAQEGREWDELMQNVWSLLNLDNSLLVKSALEIMAILFKHCEQEYAKYKDELLPVFKQYLQHDDLKVRDTTIACFCAFLKNIDSKDCKPFAELLPLVFNNIVLFIEKDEDLAVNVFAELEDLIDTEPKLFKAYVRELFDTVKAIVNHKDITTNSIKDTGCKILTVLTQKSPIIYRKNNAYVKELFEIYFTHMIQTAEEPDNEWMSPPEGYIDIDDTQGSSDNTIKFIMSLIDEVIRVLEEEQTLPILSEYVLELVKVDSWRYHYAALMALSQVGEYIQNVEEFDPLVPLALTFLKSPHPKVRYSACHCIGMIANDVKGDFVSRFYKTITPALIEVLSDPVPHVVGHDLSALTNVLENCSTEAVKDFITPVLEHCINFLNTGISLVKENSLSAISTIAQIGRRHFVPFWEKTAEIVFTLLNSTNDLKYKALRGHCIECLTLMGLGVGAEEFQKCAREVIQKMVEIQKTDIAESDPQKHFLMASWKRICTLMKEDLVPYMDSIIPSLFEMINGIVMEEKEKREARRQKDNEANDVKEIIGNQGANDNKLLYVTNTSESGEIMVGVDMMNTFLKNLGKHYLPYVEKTSEVLIFLIENSANQEVRFAAAQTLPEISKILASSPEFKNQTEAAARNYVNVLWNAQDGELDPNNISKFVKGITDVVKVSGRYMSEQEVNMFSEKIIEALQQSEKRKNDMREDANENAEDLDEDDVEMMEEDKKDEEELQCAFADLMGALFESHKELTLPLVNFIKTQLLPKVFSNNVSAIMNRFGVYLVDNLIEYLGLELIPNDWIQLTQALCQYATHKDGEVRQAAVYGIGVLAERAGDSFEQVKDMCLKALVNAIQMKKPEGEDKLFHLHAKDNAAASLGRVIKSQAKLINVKEAMKIWLGALPLKNDKMEGKEQHELLVDIILDGNENLVFGENGEHFAKVIKIFAEVVDTQMAKDTFKDKMVKVSQTLVANEATKELLVKAIGSLNEQLQAKLERVLG